MRSIEYSSQFKKDFKREKKSARCANLESDLKDVLDFLVADRVLPAAFADHPLVGDWKDFRDCHVRPDLILIYRKKGKAVLQLARLGSHSNLNL
ncbi:MAG: type II toxin-antitoxin system YafQ family toxin [Actinomycetes bacterium]